MMNKNKMSQDLVHINHYLQKVSYGIFFDVAVETKDRRI